MAETVQNVTFMLEVKNTKLEMVIVMSITMLISVVMMEEVSFGLEKLVSVFLIFIPNINHLSISFAFNEHRLRRV